MLDLADKLGSLIGHLFAYFFDRIACLFDEMLAIVASLMPPGADVEAPLIGQLEEFSIIKGLDPHGTVGFLDKACCLLVDSSVDDYECE